MLRRILWVIGFAIDRGDLFSLRFIPHRFSLTLFQPQTVFYLNIICVSYIGRYNDIINFKISHNEKKKQDRKKKEKKRNKNIVIIL